MNPKDYFPEDESIPVTVEYDDGTQDVLLVDQVVEIGEDVYVVLRHEEEDPDSEFEHVMITKFDMETEQFQTIKDDAEFNMVVALLEEEWEDDEEEGGE